VTLLGSGYGRVNYSPALRVHGPTDGTVAAFEAVVWLSDTHVIGKSPSRTGSFGRTKIAVTAQRNVNTMVDALQFQEPKATSFRSANAPTTGAVSVTVYGSRLGNVDESSVIRYARTSMEASVWGSSSSMGAKMPNSTPDTYAVIAMTINRILGTGTTVFGDYPMSTDTATASAIIETNLATTGAMSVTILGAGMGASAAIGGQTARVRVGGSAVAGSTWIGTTSVMAKPIAGSPTCVGVQISVSRKPVRRTTTNAISFDMIRATNLLRTNAPPTGSTSVTVLGLDMSIASAGYTSKLRASGTAGAATVWVSNSAMVAKSTLGVPFTASSMRNLIALTTSWQRSTTSNVLSMDVFATTSPSNLVRTNAPSTGGQSLTLFGIASYARSSAIRMLSTGAENSFWTSLTSVRVRSISLRNVYPGNNAAIVITESTLHTIGSLSNTITFDAPMVNTIQAAVYPFTPFNSPTTGGVSVTLSVRNFALSDASPRAYLKDVGGSSPVATKWVSSSSVVVKLPYHSGTATANVLVSIGGKKSDSITQSFSYT